MSPGSAAGGVIGKMSVRYDLLSTVFVCRFLISDQPALHSDIRKYADPWVACTGSFERDAAASN